ncbi:hypothetical protein N7494_001881 [Penicillium frequentans]|uniref:Uncharacterized protein n=1 Tax=Penicillium frequentans TaxID=3151616 RepID=A0AAD6D4L9_9EURO|nr:hypothetical protein N7494_001881 [Penicillium glabrum]
MDMFNRKARSKFLLRDGDGIINKDVQFSFTLRSPTSTSEPRSVWGLQGNDRICLIYFDIEFSETSIHSVVDKADTKLDFCQNDTDFALTEVAPANEIKPKSEQQFSQRIEFAPNINAGVGGGSLGSYVDERQNMGLPDWRFKGSLGLPRPTQAVSWTWTRGGHYHYSRGIPNLIVGVIGKNHPEEPFTGTVSITLKPRRPWRRSEKREFIISFSPPETQNEDISARIELFQSSVVL